MSKYIEVHGSRAGERTLIKADNIEEVFEVLPGARFRPTISEDGNAKTIIFTRGRSYGVLETYRQVKNLIAKALEA